MRRIFAVGAIIILTGIILMAVGEAMSLFAVSEWSDADKDYFDAYQSYGIGDDLDALEAFHEASIAGANAVLIWDVGMMIAFAGIVVLGFGHAVNGPRQVGQLGYVTPSAQGPLTPPPPTPP